MIIFQSRNRALLPFYQNRLNIKCTETHDKWTSFFSYWKNTGGEKQMEQAFFVEIWTFEGSF